jgi:hypothetical protein
MNLSEEFRRFAAECERMAKLTHNRENKNAWRRMSERWLQNAKSFEQRHSAPGPQNRHRKRPHVGLTEPGARVLSPLRAVSD